MGNTKNQKGIDIFRIFTLYHKYMEDQVIEWRLIDSFELLITLRDGSKIIYYELDNSICPYVAGENNFGAILRGKLLISGLRQKELSDKTGISKMTISRYISGKNEPTYTNLVKIADALHCSLNDFRIEE